MLSSFTLIQKPIQLVSINSLGKLVLNPQAMLFLNELPSPISILSIAGPYRTGKSYLLNNLLSNNKAFMVGHTTNATTHGLWVWSKPILAQNSQGKVTNVIIIDSEGFSSTEETYDKKIVTLALLISTCFLYNSRGTIDKQSLLDLEFVVEVVRAMESVNKVSAFPCDFHWILRGFHLNLINQLGKTISPKQYMQNCLCMGSKNLNQNTIQTLKTYFPNRYCHCLIEPNFDQNGEPRPQFTQHIIQLRKIINGIKSVQYNGESLMQLLQSYIDSFNENNSLNEVCHKGYDCKIRLACIQKLNNQLKQFDQYDKNGVKIDAKLQQIKQNIKNYYSTRMNNKNQINYLQNQINQIVQQFKNQNSNKFIQLNISLEEKRKKSKIFTMKKLIEVSVLSSQKKIEELKTTKKIFNIHSKSEFNHKIEQYEAKLQRYELQNEALIKQLENCSQSYENLKKVCQKMDDQINQYSEIILQRNHQEKQIIESMKNQIEKQKTQVHLLKSQISKTKFLYDQRIANNQQSYKQEIQRIQKSYQKQKQKYSTKIEQLLLEIQYNRCKYEQQIIIIKQIYKIQQNQEKVEKLQIDEQLQILNKLSLQQKKIEEQKDKKEFYFSESKQLKQINQELLKQIQKVTLENETMKKNLLRSNHQINIYQEQLSYQKEMNSNLENIIYDLKQNIKQIRIQLSEGNFQLFMEINREREQENKEIKEKLQQFQDKTRKLEIQLKQKIQKNQNTLKQIQKLEKSNDEQKYIHNQLYKQKQLEKERFQKIIKKLKQQYQQIKLYNQQKQKENKLFIEKQKINQKTNYLQLLFQYQNIEKQFEQKKLKNNQFYKFIQNLKKQNQQNSKLIKNKQQQIKNINIKYKKIQQKYVLQKNQFIEENEELRQKYRNQESKNNKIQKKYYLLQLKYKNQCKMLQIQQKQLKNQVLKYSNQKYKIYQTMKKQQNIISELELRINKQIFKQSQQKITIRIKDRIQCLIEQTKDNLCITQKQNNVNINQLQLLLKQKSIKLNQVTYKLQQTLKYQQKLQNKFSLHKKDKKILMINLEEMQNKNQQYRHQIIALQCKINNLNQQQQIIKWKSKYQQTLQLKNMINRNYEKDYQLWQSKLKQFRCFQVK